MKYSNKISKNSNLDGRNENGQAESLYASGVVAASHYTRHDSDTAKAFDPFYELSVAAAADSFPLFDNDNNLLQFKAAAVALADNSSTHSIDLHFKDQFGGIMSPLHYQNSGDFKHDSPPILSSDPLLALQDASSILECLVNQDIPAGEDKKETKQRSEKNKQAKRKRSKTHTPRPSNSFILYRREKHLLLTQSHLKKNETKSKLNNNVISKVVAGMWREESAEVRERFGRMAEEEKIKHGLLYPDYKYRPRKTPNGQVTAKKGSFNRAPAVGAKSAKNLNKQWEKWEQLEQIAASSQHLSQLEQIAASSQHLSGIYPCPDVIEAVQPRDTNPNLEQEIANNNIFGLSLNGASMSRTTRSSDPDSIQNQSQNQSRSTPSAEEGLDALEMGYKGVEFQDDIMAMAGFGFEWNAGSEIGYWQ